MEIPLLAFGLLAIVTVATPGPTVLLARTNGSQYGFARASAGIIGAGLSDLVLITAAALGLGAVLATSAFWFSVVKWVRVAYLAWLGVQMLRSAGKFGEPSNRNGSIEHGGSAQRSFRKSLLVAVTNPKGYLFFAAFLPQFIDTSQPLPSQYQSSP